MYSKTEFESLVITRLFDFFGNKTPWHRQLWELGTVLSLKELLEVSQAVNSSILTESSLEFFLKSLPSIIGKDRGVGSTPYMRTLQECLKSKLRYKGSDYIKIEQLTKDIDEAYLEKWAEALKDHSKCPGPERTARSIASHLLDLGFHPDFLHRWLTYQKNGAVPTPELHEIVERLNELSKQPLQEFNIFLPFGEPLKSLGTSPSICLDEETFAAEFDKAGFGVSKIRAIGGLKLKIQSREHFSAAEKSGEIVDSFIARIIVGSRSNPPIMNQKVWIEGVAEPVSYRRSSRGVEVHALEGANQLYTNGVPSLIDAAIELLAPLAYSSPSAGIVGGWAAVEALLGTAGDDRVLAGDRLATIITCSFPRAELTTISYKVDKGTPLGVKLKAEKDKRKRSFLVYEALENGETVVVNQDSDLAAVERMKALISDPSTYLNDLYYHLSKAFRRMYRHRNLVSHGGKTDAVALRACSRTIAPLVGEGIDRITSAWFKNGTSPIEFSARSSVRLAIIGTAEGSHIIDLLY